MSIKKKIDPNQILNFIVSRRGSNVKNEEGKDTEILTDLTMALYDTPDSRRLIEPDAIHYITNNIKEDDS